jgi:tRNA A37 threonylcarbamoyladenosine synthetase subunit TsaC/SUA5/YrdC
MYRLNEIIEELMNGNVVCLKTDTVYGLFCTYGNTKGYDKIYELKNRNSNKFLGIYLSQSHEKYQKYYEKFGDLTGLTIIENKQSYRFCGLFDDLIDIVGPLWGTSANESGYFPITSPNNFKLNCLIYDEGFCPIGLESTVYSIDNQSVVRYGYKYMEPLPNNLNIKYKSYNKKNFITIKNINSINNFNFWYYLNNGYEFEFPESFEKISYINELIYKTYKSIDFS